MEGLYFLLASLFLLYGLMRSCCAVLLVWLDLSVQKKINLDEEGETTKGCFDVTEVVRASSANDKTTTALTSNSRRNQTDSHTGALNYFRRPLLAV